MKFEDFLEGDVAVIDVSGKIMGGEETTLFHGKIHEYIQLNKKNIVIDLSKVDWMNSVGLGMFPSEGQRKLVMFVVATVKIGPEL